MYLLIFQAWATLMGFTLQDEGIIWGEYLVRSIYVKGPDDSLTSTLTSWSDLVNLNPLTITIDYNSITEDLYTFNEVKNALMLTNIMTHVSMILIFVFFVCFVIWLFRLFGHMLSRR